METLILITVAAVVPSVVFGVLFFLHARGERAAIMDISKEAFVQLNSKDSIAASAAKAQEMYQQEAIREQAIEFDKKEPFFASDDSEDGPKTLTDQHGRTYEVLAGMD